MQEKMERALAIFVSHAMRTAVDAAADRQKPAPATPDTLAGMAQMERLVGRLEGQMAALAAGDRFWRDEIAAMRPPPAKVADGTALRP